VSCLVGNDDGHNHVFEVREELQEQELEGWVQNKNWGVGFRMSIENCSAEFVFDTLAMSFSSSSTLALEAALSSLIANRQKKDKARAVAKPKTWDT
jgi:hypothetical protein